jgi:hypothetical protein
MLWNRDDLGMSMRYEASAGAARSIGVTVQPLGVRAPDDFDRVFETMDRNPPDAILLVADVLTNLNRKRVFDYAAAHHIPALYEYDLPWVRDGGLISYGPDLQDCFERAAALTARNLVAPGRPICRSRSRHATSWSSIRGPFESGQKLLAIYGAFLAWRGNRFRRIPDVSASAGRRPIGVRLCAISPGG